MPDSTKKPLIFPDNAKLLESVTGEGEQILTQEDLNNLSIWSNNSLLRLLQ